MRCLLVSVGAKQIRVAASVNGEKIGKVELGSKFGTVVSSQVVEHNRMLVYYVIAFRLSDLRRITCTCFTDRQKQCVSIFVATSGTYCNRATSKLLPYVCFIALNYSLD